MVFLVGLGWCFLVGCLVVVLVVIFLLKILVWGLGVLVLLRVRVGNLVLIWSVDCCCLFGVFCVGIFWLGFCVVGCVVVG